MSLNEAMAALVAELADDEIPQPLNQRFVLANMWADLARIAGEALPAEARAVVGRALDATIAPVMVRRGSYAEHAPSPPQRGGPTPERRMPHRSATMKLLTIAPSAVTVELDATDCLVLADALATLIYYDACPDHSFVNALRASLEACAVLAATDTLRDNRTPEVGMLDDTRRVWGPLDTQHRGLPRMTRRPR